MNPFSRSGGIAMPPVSLDSMVQAPWNFLTSFSRSALSSAGAPVPPDAANPTAQNIAASEILNRFILHLTRFGDERAAKAPRIALFHLGDLYEITAGVVKDGRGNWPHVHGRLSEAKSRANETFVFRVHILHAKRREGNPVLHERPFERLDRRVLVRFQHELHAVRVVRRYDGQPPVRVQQDLGLLDEAEHVRVEPERLVLIVH